MFWSFTDNLLQQIVNFVVGVILARILLPEEFGILGIISVFIAVSNTFVNSGLSDALINKKDTTDIDLSTVFWANVFLGIFTYALLFFTAPLVAGFFEEDSLIVLIRITALSVVLISFSSIQRTILTKNLDFRTITIISIISVLLSGIVAVYMALKGYGVLSLVVRIVLGQLFTLFLFWLLNKWRPKLVFNFESFRSMYSYGVNLFLSRITNSIYDNLYYFVIGKFFSPANLGYYTRAESLKNLVSTNLISTVQRVSFSVLSSNIDNKSQMDTFVKFLSGTFFVTSFFMSILFISANEIIIILLGTKWIVSIEYLQILAVSGLFMPLYVLNINFLAVKNKTRLYFKIEFFTKIFSIPAIVIGFYFGIIPMLFSIVVVSFLSYLVSVLYIYKLFNYSYLTQLALVFKGCLLFLISVFLVKIINEFGFENLYFKFICDFAIISFVFLIGLQFLFKELKSEVVLIKNNFRK